MKKIFIFFIKIYQRYISSLKRMPTCKFYPTCSSYAIQAITRYGLLRGGFKAIIRILKCNPFSKGGYDPMV